MSKRVAIIGAGPGGLVAAKFLLQQGLQPVVFEQSDQAGGHWHVRNTMSGIWPGMPTNTSCIMTQFSDLEHLPDTPAFPTAEQIHDYLQRYIDAFGIGKCLRLNCRVLAIERGQDSPWQVRFTEGEMTREEKFDFVLVASGRFNRPYIPAIPGLETTECLETRSSIRHSHQYMGPAEFQGQRVLVAGGAISALEIASDLALHSNTEVSCAYRNQRYVLRKMAQGIPTDHINFCLYEALAAERLEGSVTAERMREWVLEEFGNPEDFGAPRPHQDLRQAGTTKCEHFLDLVAEKRINIFPWLQQVDGKSVHFSDGSRAQFDSIIFATGYQLDFPFLQPAEVQVLALTSQQLGLYQHTFHPDLPGFAMLGFYNQVGPYFPVLELQARWIAHLWSGRIAAAETDSMQKGLQAYLDSWHPAQKLPMHKLALLFARAIGAEPRPEDWSEIARALWFGPLAAMAFRLSGPDSLAGAGDCLAAMGREFGMIPDPQFTDGELQKLRELVQQDKP